MDKVQKHDSFNTIIVVLYGCK